jgi:hypothetical protein
MGGRPTQVALALAAAALLALPGSALGWAEVTTRNQPGGGPSTCLRPASGGSLGLVGPVGQRTVAFDLVRGSRLAPAGRARFGRVGDCATVAANDAGAAAVANVEYRRRSGASRLRVAVRDRPGAPLRTTTLATPRLGPPQTSKLAVGPAGDMAVAWTIPTRLDGIEPARVAVVVARRRPGGSFGRPQRLDEWRLRRFSSDPALAVAIDERGATTVVWTAARRPPRRVVEDVADVRTATAARGESFGRARRIAREAQDVGALELAVRPSGEALLALVEGFQLRLFERAGADFTRLRRFGDPRTFPGPAEASLAQAPDGSAVLAWRVGSDLDGSVHAVTRTGAGSFGRPARLAPAARQGNGSTALFDTFGGGGASAPYDHAGGFVRAAIGVDGRPVVTWLTRRRVAGERLATAYAAAGRAAGGFGRRARLSSPCRPADGAAPAALPDGRLAAAWTDNITENVFSGLEVPAAKGRLHLALADEPRSAPPKPPRVKVSGPRLERLQFGDPLRVRVRCDRACDIRALIPRRPGDGRDIRFLPPEGPRAIGMASLSRAGSAVVRVSPGFEGHVAPKNPRPVRVVVRACAPGGDDFDTAAMRVRVLRRPVPPLPRIVGVTARRHGRRVVVHWQTDRPARRVGFAVFGRERRTQGDPPAAKYRRGRGRTRFRTTLNAERGVRIRWVTVFAVAVDPPNPRRKVSVRVR